MSTLGTVSRHAGQSVSRLAGILTTVSLVLAGLVFQAAVAPASQASGPLTVSGLCRSISGDGTALEGDKTKNGYYTSLASRESDTLTGVKIEPLFAKRMYVDPGRGFDATYIAYRLTNSSGSDLSNLTLKLDGFEGTVVQPVSAEDNSRFVGDLANTASKTIFFMLKATATSDFQQRHNVRLFQAAALDPGTQTQLAGCYTNINGVQRSLSASANKVTAIRVVGSPVLGGTFSIEVDGAPGTVGAGNDIDGSVMALSPATNASWPTKAIRLETVSVEVKGIANASAASACDALPDSTDTSTTGPDKVTKVRFDQTLVIRGLNTCVTNTKQTYTATYTYRVVGFAASNPAIRPYASIGSGTQVKYTGTLPSASVSVQLTGTTIPLTVIKSFVSSTPATDGADGIVATYKITATATSTVALSELQDKPDAAVSFISATYTDDLKTVATAISKTNLAGGLWSFVAPFQASEARPLVLTYNVLLPKPVGASVTYKNEGFAVYGGKVIGSGEFVTGVAATVDSDGQVATTTTTTAAPKTPQTISFSPPATMGSNTSITLAATSDSGLPVSYESVTPNICSVSEFNGVWVLTSYQEGDCQITAKQAGNTTFDAATNVTKTITVLKGQVISYTATSFTSNTVGATASVTISATSDLPVTLVPVDTAVCSVSVGTAYNAATGVTVYTVTSKTTSGSCLLAASQPGDDTWGAAPNRDIIIGLGTAQAIDFSSPANGANFTYAPSASFNVVATAKTPTSTGSNTVNPVSFTSSTPAVCSVRTLFDTDGSVLSGMSAGGTTTVPVDIIGPGTCTITASQDGLKDDGTQSIYAPAADVTRSFTISGSGTVEQKLVFEAVAGKAYGDANFQAKVTSQKTSDASVTGLRADLESTTPGVCAIGTPSLNGSSETVATVLLVGAGDCTLRATQLGSATYKSATPVDLTFAIAPKALVVSGLTATKLYDGNTGLTFAGQAVLAGTVPGDGLAEIALSAAPTGIYGDADVDSYQVSVGGLELTGSKLTSYTLTPYSVSASISQRPITITFGSKSVAPSADVTCLESVSVTSGSLVRAGSVTAVSCAGIPPKDQDSDTKMLAGSYTVTPSAAVITEAQPSSANKTSNYLISYVAGTLTVSSKAIPVIETADIEVFYGYLLADLNLETTADTSGAPGKTKVKHSASPIAGALVHKKDGAAIATGLPAGEHAVTVEFTPTDSTTYETASTQRKIKVNKRPITFKPQSESKMLGDSDPSFSYGISAGSFAPAETVETIGGLQLSRAGAGTTGETVGSHPINVALAPLFSESAFSTMSSSTVLTSRANYDIAFETNLLYIASADVVLDQSKSTDQIQGVCAGFKPGSVVTLTMTGDPDIAIATATVASDGTCPDLKGSIPAGAIGDKTLVINGLFPNDDPIVYSESITIQSVFTITYSAPDATGTPAGSWTTGTGFGSVQLFSGSGLQRSGFVLTGWLIEGVTYGLGGSFNLTSNASAAAIWTLAAAAQPTANSFTLTLDCNYQGSSTPNAVSGSGLISLPTANCARSGYDFKGWSTSANGPVGYAPGSSFLLNAPAKLFAVWAVKVFQVNLDPRGGSPAQAPILHEPGSAPLSLPVPTRAGYTFLGWSTSINGTVIGATYAPTADVTLYAKWKKASAKLRSSVYFEGDSARLTTATKARLRTLAARALRSPSVEIQVQVEGWVRRTSDTSYDTRLSTQRAKNVVAELRRLGVKASYSQAARGVDKKVAPTARRADVTVWLFR